jgi:hypothetical protein
MFWVGSNMGLHIAIVVVCRQFYQIVEHVHDCHHYECESWIIIPQIVKL